MIRLHLTSEAFEQDIRPLMKSFFPKEELVVSFGGKPVDFSFGAKEGHEPADWGRYLLFGDWREDGFVLSLYRDGNTTVTVQREEKEVDLSERKKFRDEVKRGVYRMLSAETGKKLPWGTLTGVRPVKQVLERLEAGEDASSIDAFLKEEYYCSEEKRALSLSVAAKEKELLTALDYKNSYSLYVGIPFCPTTCLYCSFTSYPLSRFGHQTGAYVEALKKEIEASAKLLAEKRLATVYFGGGTPTALSAEELRDVIRTVKKYFPTEEIAEWTVEAGRPDTITTEKLLMLYEEGISRISINPQTMNQKTLDVIGRCHTTEDICRAFEEARRIGFDNINMDLIIGLTGENAADVKETLRKIGALSPDSVTVHTLALKRAARLNIEKEQYEDKGAVQVGDMLTASVRFAKENGYAPYYLYRQKNMEENLENVGYARPGKEGLYNILIMEEKHSILALGAGGATKLVLSGGERIERSENVKSLKDYLERTEEMIARKHAFFEQYKGLY
ncbi:MAG: coproporphyrinogen dehydrogenase HemZ [Lachnospiraceae bacterium]|nr:coproporphyrinogen dehydrogenase HemZ [Lachnospiraceae bacterium]